MRPLAERLGVPIDTSFACGHEAAVAAAALKAPGPTLIAWHHSHIGDIVSQIAGPAAQPQWRQSGGDGTRGHQYQLGAGRDAGGKRIDQGVQPGPV